MKKLLLLTILIAYSTGCGTTKMVDEKSDCRNEIIFYDLSLLDESLKGYEEDFESKVDYVQKTTKSTESNSLLFNNRELMAKFLCYFNFTSESNFDWVICFENKYTGKLINIIENNPLIDNINYETISKETFDSLMQEGMVDLKIMKNNSITNYIIANDTLNNNLTKSSEDLLPTDDFYIRTYGEPLMKSNPVLGGVTNHVILIRWYRKIAYTGYYLNDPRPEVDTCISTIDILIGDYTETSVSSFFIPEGSSLTIGTIKGYCDGIVNVTAEGFGLTVGISKIISTEFEIEVE